MSITVIKYKCGNPASIPLKQADNNAITNVPRGMPTKFRNADGESSFSLGRNAYVKAPQCNAIIVGDTPYNSIRVDSRPSLHLNSNTYEFYSDCNPIYPNSGWSNTKITIPGQRNNALYKTNTRCCKNGKMTQVASSDEYITRRKNRAIGKGSNTTSNNTQLSFQGTTTMMEATQARRKTRNSGYVVPPKVRGNICGQSKSFPVTPLFGTANKNYEWIQYIQSRIASLQSEIQNLLPSHYTPSIKEKYQLIYFEDTPTGLDNIFTDVSNNFIDLSNTNIFNTASWNADISGHIMTGLNHNLLNTVGGTISISDTSQNTGLVEPSNISITFTQHMIDSVEFINHNQPYSFYTNGYREHQGLHLLHLVNRNDISNSSFSSNNITLDHLSPTSLTHLFEDIDLGDSTMFHIFAYYWNPIKYAERHYKEIKHIMYLHVKKDITNLVTHNLHALEAYADAKIAAYEATITTDIKQELDDQADRIYDAVHKKIKEYAQDIANKKRDFEKSIYKFEIYACDYVIKKVLCLIASILSIGSVDLGTDGAAAIDPEVDEKIGEEVDKNCLKVLIQKIVVDNKSLQYTVNKIITHQIQTHICNPLITKLNEYAESQGTVAEHELLIAIKGEISKFIDAGDQTDIKDFLIQFKTLTKSHMNSIINSEIDTVVLASKKFREKIEKEALDRLHGTILSNNDLKKCIEWGMEVF
jgi:hypothetical protein